MAFTTSQTTVAELSQAAYGRILANTGLDFYANHLDAGTMTADEIRAEFMSNTEAGIRYPDTATDDATVQQVFNNVLGRDAAQTGVDFYAALLADGTIDKSSLVSMILADAKGLSGGDATFINDAVVAGEVVYDAADETPDENEGTTYELTTSNDTFVGTSANDTFTGTSTTIAGGDIIIDQSSTDNDTLNMTLTAINAALSVSGVENVNADWNAFGTAAIDATNIDGATITGSSTKTGFLGSLTITAAGDNTVVAGSGMDGTLTANDVTTGVVTGGEATIVTAISAATATADDTVTVTAGANTTAVNVGYTTAGVADDGFTTAIIDAGTATTIRIDDADSAADDADTAALTFGATATLTNTVDDVVVTASAADLTLTVDNVEASLDFAGTENTTLNIDDATDLTTEVVTNSSTGTLALTIDDIDGAADLDEVAADTISIAAATVGGALTVSSGANVTAEADLASAYGLTVAGTATTDTATLNISTDQSSIITFAGIETATLAIDATAVSNAADVTVAEINAGTNDVVVTGANDAVFTLVEAAEMDATAVTADLTITQDAAAAMDILGGTADNTVTFKGTTHANNYVGQDGDDDITFATTTGAGVATATAVVGGGDNDVTAAALTDGDIVVIGGSGIDTVTTGAITDVNMTLELGAGNNVVSLGTVGNAVLDAATIEITTGAGNDGITLNEDTTANTTITLTLGEGTNTLVLDAAGDISLGTWSVTGLNAIDMTGGGAASTVAASLVSGEAISVTATATAGDIFTVVGTVALGETIDLSTLVMDQTISDAVISTSVTGNAGNDTITGTAIADAIDSLDGNDTITGGTGADAMTAGAGNDKFVIADGDSGDAADGSDADTIFEFGTAGTDTLSLGTAATATNYAEDSSANTTAANAIIDAVALLDGTVMYGVAHDDTNGEAYLAVDLDLDQTVDYIIEFDTLDVTGLAFADIIA